MTCQRLFVTEAGEAPQRGIELSAVGNTLVEGNSFTAKAQRLSYIQAKDQLVLDGENGLAQLQQQRRPGEKPTEFSARQIKYWVSTGQVEVFGATQLDYTHIGTPDMPKARFAEPDMNSLRLVLVTRRFWPLVGGAETATANLARGLRSLGVTPTILTGRHDAQWPADVVHREIPVHRLPYPRFRWGTLRYLIALSRWLQKNRPDIDVVCVSRLAHEAHTVIGALAGSGIPVVIRAEADESFDLTHPAKTGRAVSRTLRRCLQAQAIVAATAQVEQQVQELGIDRRRIHRISNGVKLLPPRSPCRQDGCPPGPREVNEDLRVPANQPVALCIGQLHPDNAWEAVIRAWKQVAEQWPFARLWLVGEGPHREALYRRIRDADLVGRVLMPGEFDSTDDLLMAADLLVVPTTVPKESVAVLEAMAAGLPVLVSAESGHQELVTDGVTGRVFPGRNPTALASAISRSFHHPMQADALAAAALARVRATRSLRGMATSHLQLFQHLVSSSVRTVP